MVKPTLFSTFILALGLTGCASFRPTEPARASFPTVPARHTHARALLANCFQYVTADNGVFDPASGFPVEGWNNDPGLTLHLREFTQLTAIGEWVELLSVVIAGQADTPQLSRKRAEAELTRVVKSLRDIQINPRLSDRGLLVNFLAFLPEKQDAPLAGDVTFLQFTDSFGQEKGKAIWDALRAQNWIEFRNQGKRGEIRRGSHYGTSQFKGELAPFDNEADRHAILEILDQRVVTIIFGDNANLSSSIGKAIGMLQHPDLRSRADLLALRQDMESFLDAQRKGYEHLYDVSAGRFYFGWDATRKHRVGWDDEPAHNDYLINEFRGPTQFVILRFGFPSTILGQMGSVLKFYTLRTGTEIPVTAAWDGSLFQILGLGLMMDELRTPSWKTLLSNAVLAAVDYSDRHSHPGFLSEAYTGNGAQYTGRLGIPELAVTDIKRITTSPSLYTLGVAYLLEPDLIEAFLARHWQALSSQLLTEHGPWEGLDMASGKPIRFQTSAHTLSLALGLLGTGPDAMRRYLDSRNLLPRLDEWNKRGQSQDLLASANSVFAWSAGGTIQARRSTGEFHFEGLTVDQPCVAVVSGVKNGFNLSNGKLVLRYRSKQTLPDVTLQFKPQGAPPPIMNQAKLSLPATGDAIREVALILPASPGFSVIQELVFNVNVNDPPGPVNLTFTALRFEPLQESLK